MLKVTVRRVRLTMFAVEERQRIDVRMRCMFLSTA
jgi:hypothetical protein